MTKFSLTAAAGAAALVLAATAPAPVQAASVHLTHAFGSVATESNVIEVQRNWRRDRRWDRRWDRRRDRRWDRRWDRRDRNAWIALGLGSAIVGGMLAAPGAPGYAYAGDAWERCAAQFRSLRPDGTYTTYDGRQVLCPYLR